MNSADSTVFRAPLPRRKNRHGGAVCRHFVTSRSKNLPRQDLNPILVRLSPSTNYCDYVLNGTYVGRTSDAKWFIEILNPRIFGFRGGYNVGIRLDRDSGDYLFGRLARTCFVSAELLPSDRTIILVGQVFSPLDMPRKGAIQTPCRVPPHIASSFLRWICQREELRDRTSIRTQSNPSLEIVPD